MKFKIGDYVRYVNTVLDSEYKFFDGKMQILFYDDDANTYLVIGEDEDNKYCRYTVLWAEESNLQLWNECNNFNMKVVCTYSAPGSAFKVGHVYETRNGSLYSKRNGYFGHFDSLDDLNNMLVSKFIEFKGEA